MKKVPSAQILFAAISIILLPACASPTARMVKVIPGEGGVIAVRPADSEEARKKAEDLMTRNCGTKKVVIQEEGEQVIGETTTSHGYAHATNGLFGPGVSSNGRSNSKQKTEWRISYKCS